MNRKKERARETGEGTERWRVGSEREKERY